MLRRILPWLLAALTATLYLLPTLLVRPPDWKDHFVRQFYDEEYYAVLAAATARGEPLLSNPYLGETPQTAARSSEAVTFLPRYATAYLVRLTGLGAAFTLLHVLVPVAAWFLIYSLLRRATQSDAWAMAGACAVLLLPYYLFPAVSAAKVLAGRPLEYFQTNPHWIGLPYARRFNPALSAIPLFGFLALHWRGVASQRLAPRLLAALLGGLLFYCYFFFGVFALGFAAVWGLAERVLLKSKDWLACVLPLALQLAVTIPFALWTLQSMSAFESVTVRSREPYLPWPHIVAMLLALGALGLTAPSAGRAWLAVVGLCALGVVNQHVLTGLYVEPWHFDSYVLAPLSTLVACGALGLLCERWAVWRRATPWLAALTVVVAAGFAFATQTMKARGIASPGQSWQQQPLLDFIRAQTNPDDVLMLGDSGDPTASWVPAYTGRRVYLSRYMGFIPAPDKVDYRRRAICYYWLRAAPEAELRAAADEPWSLLYTPEGSVYAFHPHLLTDEVKASMLAEYDAASVSSQGYCRADFAVDALVEFSGWRFDTTHVNQIFEVTGTVEQGDFRLFRVRYRSLQAEQPPAP